MMPHCPGKWQDSCELLVDGVPMMFSSTRRLSDIKVSTHTFHTVRV